MTGLHEVVLARAAAFPDAPAITTADGELSYRELAYRASGLAARLRAAAGVEAERLVGVVVDQTANTLVAFLGVLMAGGGYVPLAADLPAERLRVIAEDARLAAVTGRPGPAAATIEAPFVAVDGPPSDQPPATADPAHVAYVIFTSGSTGRPKGVVVSHGAIVASTNARFTTYPYEAMAYLVTAPLTIDAAAAGLYFALFTGGRVVLPTPEAQTDPHLLADVIRDEHITHFDGLPSQYAMLLDFCAERLTGLRCVVLGGEALPHQLAKRHLATVPDAVLFNEYGPTEGTIWCATHRCTTQDTGPRVPIGHAISGARLMVLTDDLRPAPPGVLGEVYLGGAGLARGYLNEPGRTAERFVADPNAPGELMYRTGDLGEVDTSGELVFRGRVDHMVKVRGHRVELDEVETGVLAHPDVASAVVIPHHAAIGTRLVGVVTFAPGRSVGTHALTAFLRERLPGYMVPTVWRLLDALPVTSAGKVDRLALGVSAVRTGTAIPS